MFYGIDLGGTKLQFAVGKDQDVFVLDKVPTPLGYEELLRVVEEHYLEAERKFGEQIAGMAIGIPGTFTKEKVVWVPNIPYIEGHDLAGDLSMRLGVPVYLGNDAQLALVGEVWRGAGVGYTNAVLMSIGTGIGGAIMIGGKVVKGRRGAAGALGWLNLDASVPGDKNHGYLENHASGKAIAAGGAGHEPVISTYEIVARAKQGDEFGKKTMDQVGHLIGAGLASIASVLDTEIIILSGGLSEEFATYKDSMEGSFREFTAPGIESIPIVKSKLGNQSGAFGAVRLAMVGHELWIG
ncbi:ROK family protein [Neobacillus drentensis]|uniref:ROK family protein n=1 Tax=Neobacillus drentensis TaxID=220684 RepID=UPI0028637409|nr:ROK family protein [Neobacillus drentensis]MDR7238862.1 glucokinase [Neobacillus drentensis]